MIIQRLELTHFRCLARADMEFAADRNVITGSNAAGKTSILEAIFLLGSGRSFRSSSLDLLVQDSARELVVIGRFVGSQHLVRTIGIGCKGTQKEIRVDGQKSNSAAELAKCFPVQVIDPEVHLLLDDGPRRRRTFIDWGVFHVEPSFHECWRRFNRALKQRNAALKSRLSVAVWDDELAACGTAVHDHRWRYIQALAPFVSETGQRLLQEDVSIEYIQGWKRTATLPDALKESRARDQQFGTTTVGPHRADLRLLVGGHVAKDRISRGQQKMLACVLLLAQQLHRASLSSHAACLLLDDPAAELDVHNLGKLLELIDELPVQLIATGLTSSSLSLFRNAKKFHVEHGLVKAVA